jgi:hypothetical protein
VIDRNGRIAYKPGGPISEGNLETVLKPQFEKRWRRHKGHNSGRIVEPLQTMQP